MSEGHTQPLAVRVKNQVRSYLLRHLQTMLGALGRMSRQPLGSFMTVAVIGIALALPAALHLLVVNGQALSGNWDSVADLSVYLGVQVDEKQARALADEISDWPEVNNVSVVTADTALEEFGRASGFAAALEALQANPLPHTLVVSPEASFSSAAAIAGLADALRLVPEAEIVQLDTDWVEKLNAILDVVRRAVLLTALLLALAVILIVGNTIRLDIENRRAEIEITRLVGGSDAFVRRPFLYGGLWYGLLGGLVALAMIVVGLLALGGPVARLAGAYGSSLQLVGAGPGAGLALLLGGASLGWLGAWVATTRHLRRIEPG